MTSSARNRWIPSSKANPCPICGRSKDGDCRTSGDGLEALCHHPKGLMPGEVISGNDGASWAFTGDSSDGRASHFTIDKPMARDGNRLGRKVVPFRRPVDQQPPQRQPAPLPPDPPSLARLAQPLPAAGSPYLYAEGLRVIRSELPDGSKRFRCEHRDGDGWINGAGPIPWPAFNESEALAADGWILETEGEKCAELLAAGGVVAISQPGHAHKPDQIAERYARIQGAGAPGVIYLADHDATGRTRAQQAITAAAIAGLPLLVIHAGDLWPGLPDGGSIDDTPGPIGDAVAAIETAAALAHRQWIESSSQQRAQESQLQPQGQAKRRRLAPDEVMARLPQAMGHLRLNTRSGDITAAGQLLPRNDISRAYLRLSSETESWPKETTADAVIELASRESFDPVAEYLESLPAAPLPVEQWQRLDQHLLGIDDPIAAAFLPRFLISAVARVFEPGCECRQLPVLIGPQWLGKSTLGRILFGDATWVDDKIDITSKDSLLACHTAWGVELAELDGVTRRSDQEALKAWISARADTIRKPYDRSPEKFPRRFVLWATSNGTPLRDVSGNSRFVCIPIPDRMLPLDWAKANRDAIWARALAEYRAGTPWADCSEAERQAITERNLDHRETDPWADRIGAFLAERHRVGDLPVQVPAVLDHLAVPGERQTAANAGRVRGVAESIGWQWRQRRDHLGHQKKGLWPVVPPGAPPGAPSGAPSGAPPQPSDTKGSGVVVPLVPPKWKELEKKEGGRGAEGLDPSPAIHPTGLFNAKKKEVWSKGGTGGTTPNQPSQTDCAGTDLSWCPPPAPEGAPGAPGAPPQPNPSGLADWCKQALREGLAGLQLTTRVQALAIASGEDQPFGAEVSEALEALRR